MEHQSFDIAVIGGGINGCGIARDAAGRGLSVFLCEQGDLAGATSSASTKLIHGGLRYLEHYKFRLVREALIEREVLLRAAPHIIRPMRFVLPHHSGLRPMWMIRLGLFLYDHLGGREILPSSRTVDLSTDPAGRPLKDEFARGFEYSDCWVDDARLVVLNAQDAALRGAKIRTRTRLDSAERDSEGWTLTVQNVDTGTTETVRAGAVVNAAGPWVGDVLSGQLRINVPQRVRLVKGSHIVLKRQFEHDRSYIFQNADGRIIFAIPYEQNFTLIGTTDLDFDGDPAEVKISEEEVSYLCTAARGYFERPIDRKDVVHTYSGVRPLYDDGATTAQKATRDYVITVDALGKHSPVVNVFGGKITTYRKLAEAVLGKLRWFLPDMGPEWTAQAALPGGDFKVEDVEGQVAALMSRYPFLNRPWAVRLIRSYGTLAWTVLGDARAKENLGTYFGADLFEQEVAYLMDSEWAVRADDVLWRRSKLGLRLKGEPVSRLNEWMRSRPGAEARVTANGER